MSHMCVDTTVRAANDLGYKTTTIHDACATLDLDFNGVTAPAVQVHAIDEEDQPVPAEVSSEAAAQQTETSVRKPRTTKSQKMPSTKAVGQKVRRHGPEERAEKLALIHERLAKGHGSLKAAVAEAGISDQTYYQWKRAAKPADAAASIAVPPASVGNELADLIKLDQENQRLRQLLAENAELRRRSRWIRRCREI